MIRSGADLVCVGRTLLSAAFEVGLVLSVPIGLSVLECEFKTKIKSGGQECPPHTSYLSFVTVTSS